uniref:N(6)-L-threonylcarbamoyladenine synthase n=1 Tax=Ananas comosus var. bracteatus TaxID=296719 RepID=A0A6V7NJZ2_ANACO|nr:unnamed protein product [Ananas comosus var. bracteatus]
MAASLRASSLCLSRSPPSPLLLLLLKKPYLSLPLFPISSSSSSPHPPQTLLFFASTRIATLSLSLPVPASNPTLLSPPLTARPRGPPWAERMCSFSALRRAATTPPPPWLEAMGRFLAKLYLPKFACTVWGCCSKNAEEAHALVIDKVVQQALDNANLTEKELSAVAVTIGPGLSLCLRVGVSKARRIAGMFRLPIVGVHHMEAHALVARLVQRDLQFPFLGLLISGGHNLLILAQSLGNYVQLGTTIDDAIGEAYDKTARWLGLNMRKGGGPALEELAREGDANSIKFSIPMRQHKDCNFSYAGLKTQVRMAIESRNLCIDDIPLSAATFDDRKLRADIAASFQCQRAIEWALKIEPSIKCLVVSGGVASNQYVRCRLNHIVEENGLKLVCPPPSLCTDNGVMIAWTGIEHFRLGRYDPPPPPDEAEDAQLDLRPRWPLGEEYSEDLNIELQEALGDSEIASDAADRCKAQMAIIKLLRVMAVLQILVSSDCLDMLAEEQMQQHITTGCEDLDHILRGGIHCGEVTEVGGVPGIGKTQLGIQLAVNVQIPVEYGGHGGKAVYIDTEGSFMVERAHQIAEDASMGY